MADRPPDPDLDPRVRAYLDTELARAERDGFELRPNQTPWRAGPPPLATLLAAIAILIVGVALLGPQLAGTVAPGGQGPSSSPAAVSAPSAGGPASASLPPIRRLVPFHDASLSEGGRTLTLEFTGAIAYSPGNPCSADYAAWAQVEGDVLRAAVADITPEDPAGPEVECAAVAYERVVTTTLPEPFTGTTVVDFTGGTHVLARENAPTEAPLKACGTEVATGPNGPWNVGARTCFWAAYGAGEPAEFTSTRPTTEGDPITTTYRVLGPGEVEVIEDTRQDLFGAQAVTRYTCRTLADLTGSSVSPDFAVNDSCVPTVIETPLPHEPSIPPTAAPTRNPDPTPRASPRTSAPSGRRFRFDAASISDDGLTLTVDYTGTKDGYSPDDPCSRKYEAWAEAAGDTLYTALVDVTPPSTGAEPASCSDIGYGHTRTVTLAEAFTGARVVDRAGYVHFVRPPDGLVELAGLPAAWQLRSGTDVAESATGAWERVYSTLASPPASGEPGRVELIQWFGGPASVSGGEIHEAVTVNGASATLATSAYSSTMLLTWDGLALEVNGKDFTKEQFIAIAESAYVP